MTYTHHYESPLGGITLAGGGSALSGLWFDGQAFFPDLPPALYPERDLPVFEQADRWLDLYFSGKDPGFRPPLSLKGTAFRRTVWEILLTVPYGRTVTYGEIAEAAARKTGLARMSSRAVGGAVGHNPVSLIIPCHRVIGADGRLTGYAGGLRRKQWLLDLERAGADAVRLRP